MTIPNTTVAFSGGSVLFNGTTVAFGEDCCCGTAGTTTPGTDCVCYQFGVSGSFSVPYAGYTSFGPNDGNFGDNSGAWTVSITRDSNAIATGSSMPGDLSAIFDGTSQSSIALSGFPYIAWATGTTSFTVTASGTIGIDGGDPSRVYTPAGTAGTVGGAYPCTVPTFNAFSLVGKICPTERVTGTVLAFEVPTLGTCDTMGGTVPCDSIGAEGILFLWGTGCADTAIGTSSAEARYLNVTNPDYELTVVGSTWTVAYNHPGGRCSWHGTKDSGDCHPPEGMWDLYPQPSQCYSQFIGNAPYVVAASRIHKDLFTGETL